MKILKVYFSIILFFFLIWGIASASPGFKIHYELEVVNTTNHLVHIKAHFINIPQDSVKLKISKQFSPDIYIKLDNVSAVSSDGNELEVQNNENDYLVSNNGDFTIKYDIRMNQKKMGYLGYLCDTYLLSTSMWTFLLPDKLKPDECSVSFKVPNGWQVVTPWEKDGENYVEKDYKSFTKSTYGAGNFDIREKNISGTSVTIAIDSHFDKEFRDTVTDNCFQIFAYTKSLFGTNGPKSHLSILAKATEPMPAQWQYSNENGSSQGEAVDSQYWTYYQYSHRVFHIYNLFYPIAMTVNPVWFVEGANEYYTILSLLKIHFGIPFSRLYLKYNDIYKKKLSTYDGPISGDERFSDDFDKEQYLYYHKGALVCYLLDMEIMKKTNGEKSLKDVLEALYKKHGNLKNGRITNEIIFETIKNVTGKDFSTFLNEYLQNNKQLEMDNVFNDKDGDGVCNGAEKLLKTNPNSKDTDSDNAVDGIEYKYKTDPLDPLSKPNLPLFIDGFEEDWNKIDYKTINDLGSSVINYNEINYTKIGDNLYFLIRTIEPASKNRSLRYYINIDTDKDKAPEFQFVAIFGSCGETSKFNQNVKTYDSIYLQEFINGPEASISEVIEYKIPLSIIENCNNFNATLGIWNTKSKNAIESTKWIKFDF